MYDKPLLSICIPTNGVIEWVFPVLDSIYKQNVDKKLFEVIITDNGNNLEFKKKIKIYIKKYSNIIYAETKAVLFLNEIEAYNLAKGELIKFLNHRSILTDGSLKKLIEYCKINMKDKPITYFSNGFLKLDECIHKFDNFNDFVKTLSYFSSCSSGMAIWNTDYKKISKDHFNELFPHTTILFAETKRKLYVVDDTVLFKDLPQGKRPKGKYDLYWAFGVEYTGIISDLLRDKSISVETYRFIANENLKFLTDLFLDYNIRKLYCSYDLDGLKNIFGVFYNKKEFICVLLKRIFIRGINKTIRVLKKEIIHFI